MAASRRSQNILKGLVPSASARDCPSNSSSRGSSSPNNNNGHHPHHQHHQQQQYHQQPYQQHFQHSKSNASATAYQTSPAPQNSHYYAQPPPQHAATGTPINNYYQQQQPQHLAGPQFQQQAQAQHNMMMMMMNQRVGGPAAGQPLLMQASPQMMRYMANFSPDPHSHSPQPQMPGYSPGPHHQQQQGGPVRMSQNSQYHRAYQRFQPPRSKSVIEHNLFHLPPDTFDKLPIRMSLGEFKKSLTDLQEQLGVSDPTEPIPEDEFKPMELHKLQSDLERDLQDEEDLAMLINDENNLNNADQFQKGRAKSPGKQKYSSPYDIAEPIDECVDEMEEYYKSSKHLHTSGEGDMSASNGGGVGNNLNATSSRRLSTPLITGRSTILNNKSSPSKALLNSAVNQRTSSRGETEHRKPSLS